MAVGKSFPYPVLGNEDDIEGKFSFSLLYSLEPERITLDCVFNLENKTIENLINEGKAVHIAEVVCAANFFREAFSSKDPKLSINIRADKLRGQVLVSSFVSTVQNISEYLPEGTHPDLQGEPFNLDAGDILAVGETASFIAEKDFDPLRAPVSSFMKIQRGIEKQGPITVEYTGDSIIIKLSHEDYDAYLNIKNSTAANLHASVVLPVLTDTLHLMGANEAEYRDQQWFARIQQICAERNLNMDEPFECAQKILQLPVARSFRNIKEILEVE